MANTFKNALSKDVGTAAATVYTCPTATQTTVIGFSISNTTASPITCNAFVTASSVEYYLVKNAYIPVGGAIVIVGGDQKLVLTAGHLLKANTSSPAGGDAVCSLLEIT
jgi:hypothetical protein